MTYSKGTDKELPIKVLAVVSHMARGGLESRLMDILRTIDSSKVRIDIYSYSLDKGVFDDEVITLGGKVFYKKPLTIWNMFLYPYYFAFFLKQHSEYQIVHAHQDAWCSVFCKGAMMAGVPVRIAHSRTAATQITLKNIIRNIIKVSVKKYATHLFAVSAVAGKWLFGCKAYENGEVVVWPNAIDSSKYIFNEKNRVDKRVELKISDKKTLIHVGNFVEAKNHTFLIDIFRNFLEYQPDSVLLLVGGGDNYKIKEKCKKLGIEDKVYFLGIRSDVSELLQAADVFVFPSIYEGLPGALLEAQASGMPCVISSSITKEAVVVDNIVKSIPLSMNIKQWCDAINESIKTKRIDTSDYFVQKGFDIKVLVNKLTEFYLQI